MISKDFDLKKRKKVDDAKSFRKKNYFEIKNDLILKNIQ